MGERTGIKEKCALGRRKSEMKGMHSLNTGHSERFQRP